MYISKIVFICLINVFFICGSVDIKLDPVNVVVSPFEHVRLGCEIAEKVFDETVVWLFESVTILSYDRRVNALLDHRVGRRYSIKPSHERSFDLVIKRVRYTDTGMYTCGYISNKTFVDLQSSKLEVVEETNANNYYPHCYTKQSLEGIRLYDSLDLNCDSGLIASPITELTWSRSGETLFNKVGLSSLSHQVILTNDDFGVTYTCKVTNLLTRKHQMCYITIPNSLISQSRPLTVTITPAVISTAVGTEALFTCNAHGLSLYEKPRYSWSILNTDLIISQRAQPQNGHRSLKIINIKATDDRSRFTCEVMTDASRRRGSSDSILYVTSSPNEIQSNDVPSPKTTSEIDKDNTTIMQVGLKIALVITALFVIIAITIVYLMVCRRNKQRSTPARRTSDVYSGVDAHECSTKKSRSLVALLFPSFNRNSRTPKTNTRRVRFAKQETIKL